MMQLSEAEQATLRKIARSKYTEINGAEPQSFHQIKFGVWADVVIQSKEDGKAFADLSKRGLVYTGGSDRDLVVALTPLGYLQYKLSNMSPEERAAYAKSIQ